MVTQWHHDVLQQHPDPADLQAVQIEQTSMLNILNMRMLLLDCRQCVRYCGQTPSLWYVHTQQCGGTPGQSQCL